MIDTIPRPVAFFEPDRHSLAGRLPQLAGTSVVPTIRCTLRTRTSPRMITPPFTAFAGSDNQASDLDTLHRELSKNLCFEVIQTVDPQTPPRFAKGSSV